MFQRIVTRAALIALACTASLAANAYAIDRKPIEIPAGELATALRTLATQAGVEFFYQTELVKGLRTEGVSGVLSAEEAVQKLLEGTSLTLQVDSSGAILITPPPVRSPPDLRPGKGTRNFEPGTRSEAADPGDQQVDARRRKSFWDRFRTAQVDQGKPTAEGSATSPEMSTPGSADSKLAEIVVTATKREERVQDIPISIAVIGNQEIERRGLIGMEDYLRSIPGVSQVDRGGLDNAIVIRGISTSAEFQNINSGTTVATYFDETPITGASGIGTGEIDLRPVDMERIEVLRGPQGTTFGSSSLGGAVRMIPAKPKLDRIGGKVVANYSQTSGHGSDNSMAQGVLNLPIVQDTFGIRAAGYRYEESGFYRNIAGIDPAEIAFAEAFGLGDYVRGHVQKNVGEMRSTGGRLAGLWKVTDKIDLSVNLLTQKIEQDGLPVATSGDFEQSRVPIAPQGRVRGDGETSDTDMDLLNMVLNYDLGWAGLTAAVSWVDSGSLYTNARSRFSPGLGPSSGSARSDFESFTSEVRLASRLEGPLQFLGGVFYEDVDQDYLQHSGDWPGAPAANPFGTDPIYLADFSRDLEQRALFGEVSYQLTSKLTATLGGRYYKYEKDNRTREEGGLFVPAVPIGTGIDRFLSNKESGSTFKANLSYEPTQDSLLYAAWSEGFRLGRPDVGVNAGACDTNGDGLIDGSSVSVESTRTIESDFLENYEIGGKFSLLDRRMLIDASVYHIKWDGLPVRNIATCGGTPYAFTANVGAAESNGAELQASLFVLEGLRLDFGAGYTKAELTKDAPALIPPAFKGDRLPGSPEVTANLGAQYDFNVGSHQAFVRVDSVYVGDFYGDLLQTPGVRAGDYIKLDTRAGISINHFDIELFVRNVTNEDAFTWRGISGALSGAVNPDFGYRLRPRTIGIQLGYRFE